MQSKFGYNDVFNKKSAMITHGHWGVYSLEVKPRNTISLFHLVSHLPLSVVSRHDMSVCHTLEHLLPIRVTQHLRDVTTACSLS